MDVSDWVVIYLRWVVVLSVFGVVVTICVGVCMVHLQSGLYCRCFICVQFRLTQCVLCVWLHLIEVCCFFICL